MKYTKLGRSNCTISVICLGTMHFGPRASKEESFRIMDRALEAGINFFDTADIYGGPGAWGRSEEIIGEWFAQGGGRRDKVVLATKVYSHENWHTPDVPAWPNIEPGISAFKVRKNATNSLRRLQTDHIDLYQVHHIDRHITGEEFWEPFERLQTSGQVSYIGTSNFPGWGLTKFQMIARQRGNFGIVSEQTMYNLFCRYPELDLFPAALDAGIGLLAYMPLGGGVLTGKRKTVKGSRSAEVERHYGLDVSKSEQLKQFSGLCREIGEEERNVAIAWTLAQTPVCSAIVGIRTVKHLEGILRAGDLELEPEVIARLNEIFDINRGRPLVNNAESPEAYAW